MRPEPLSYSNFVLVAMVFVGAYNYDSQLSSVTWRGHVMLYFVRTSNRMCVFHLVSVWPRTYCSARAVLCSIFCRVHVRVRATYGCSPGAGGTSECFLLFIHNILVCFEFPHHVRPRIYGMGNCATSTPT